MRALVRIVRWGLIKFGIIPRPDFLARKVSEHPIYDSIEIGCIYVVGGKDYQKWAYFRCPKHDEEIIKLSLMPSHRPRWAIHIDFIERPTITPSVRQLDGSFCHFWLKKGRVDWCFDSGIQRAENFLFISNQ